MAKPAWTSPPRAPNSGRTSTSTPRACSSRSSSRMNVSVIAGNHETTYAIRRRPDDMPAPRRAMRLCDLAVEVEVPARHQLDPVPGEDATPPRLPQHPRPARIGQDRLEGVGEG